MFIGLGIEFFQEIIKDQVFRYGTCIRSHCQTVIVLAPFIDIAFVLVFKFPVNACREVTFVVDIDIFLQRSTCRCKNIDCEICASINKIRIVFLLVQVLHPVFFVFIRKSAGGIRVVVGIWIIRLSGIILYRTQGAVS